MCSTLCVPCTSSTVKGAAGECSRIAWSMAFSPQDRAAVLELDVAQSCKGTRGRTESSYSAFSTGSNEHSYFCLTRADVKPSPPVFRRIRLSLKKQNDTFSSQQPFLLLLTIHHWREKEIIFCYSLASFFISKFPGTIDKR